MGNYRSDLEQAHRRIERLETELADARGARPKRSTVPLVLALITAVLLGGGIAAAVLRAPPAKKAGLVVVDVDQVVETTRLAARTGRFLGEPQKLRMKGLLAAGGIEKIQSSTGDCDIHFRLRGERNQIVVNYAHCELPDTFKDVGGLEVQVDGYAEPSLVFDAETIRVVTP